MNAREREIGVRRGGYAETNEPIKIKAKEEEATMPVRRTKENVSDGSLLADGFWGSWGGS